MTETHSGPCSFITGIGKRVCDSAEKTVNAAKSVGRETGSRIGRSIAPIKKDTKESTQKRSIGSVAANIANIAFPVASIAALALTVQHYAAQDYGVSVEYDGESIGVITGDDVLGEAQKVVADRVKYYDVDSSYYVNASLSIAPLSLESEVIDENVLAEKMEDRISMVYSEKPAEEEVTEEETLEGKVKAYAVRVNGEFLGAVEDYTTIDYALNTYRKSFDTGEYIDISFNKDVVYDLEEYVDPDDIVPQATILSTLLGRTGSTEYYEVQDGDYLTKIADEHSVTLQELSQCYATYNGKPITLQGDVLKSGTMIQFSSSVPYLDVELSREETTETEIPFSTVTVEDSTLPEGKRIVEQTGSNGAQRSHSIVTYRDGTVIRRKTLNTFVYEEPQDEIIRIVRVMPEINHNVPQFIEGTGSGEYCWPVDGGYISAHIGDRRGHKGIDIAAPYGTPIYAAAAGTVVESSTGWCGGYGNVIQILNDDGNTTVYAHQSELSAQVGDHVEMGQLIGYVGSTGDSTGNHLHFEVRSDGKYYDPEEYVSQE
ncbi:MAG: peptidoglycan DD-metalloendopeptidase family protein [Oscillospiraceae bacterium]|nr:peptidoglycan DD-metalloendopeptidase family protein [Oscillospiraceae bacterium]